MTYRFARFALLLTTIAAAVCGCQSVGNRVSQDARHADIRTGTPNTLTMADADGQWTANSVGASGWTSMDSNGVERFHQGSTPREIYWDRDKGRLVISSGSDITAKGVMIDPASGTIQLQEFSTISSENTRALSEANAALVAYWSTLTDAQRAAHVADVEAWKESGSTLAPVLLEIIKAAGGVP